jgi:hypothetical protein
LQICLEAQPLVDVENERPSTTIQIMPLATGKIRSVADVRIVKCRLRPRVFLRPCDCTYQDCIHQDKCARGPFC